MAKQIKDWQQTGKDVYLYFDNDQAAYAPFNARTIIEQLSDLDRAKREKIPQPQNFSF